MTMKLYSTWLISLCVLTCNMPWISRDSALTLAEMQNNVNIVYSVYTNMGYTTEAIAAICANMQVESSINPGRNEIGGGGGYGLVQWTPKSKLINACKVLGLTPYTDGTNQLVVLDAQLQGKSGLNSWYTTSAFVSPYYSSGATSDMIGVTGYQFKQNQMQWDVGKLAILFMVAFERPSYDPNKNHWQLRQEYAKSWYEYLTGKPPDPPPTPIPTFRNGNFFTLYLKRRL